MIAVIDYGAGNLQSVCNALTKLQKPFQIIHSPENLKDAQKIILPGVGAAGNAMQSLKERGFIDPLLVLKKPFLGICLGMQLLAEFSEEGDVPCFSLFPGRVKKFQTDLKVPHVGWNAVDILQDSPLTAFVNSGAYFYFVHSYYFDAPAEIVVAQTDYDISFPAIICRDNFYAVQFHPEKSGENGLQILRNFCDLC